MQDFNRIVLSFVFLVCFPLICGCSGDKYGMVTVQGKVTHKGQPLKHGSIAFHPMKTVQQGVPHRMGIGAINSDGTYTLSTFKKDDGVMPGEYAIVVIYREKAKASDKEDYNPPSLIPERYNRSETTPLKATISDGKAGPLTFDFNIEDK